MRKSIAIMALCALSLTACGGTSPSEPEISDAYDFGYQDLELDDSGDVEIEETTKEETTEAPQTEVATVAPSTEAVTEAQTEPETEAVLVEETTVEETTEAILDTVPEIIPEETTEVSSEKIVTLSGVYTLEPFWHDAAGWSVDNEGMRSVRYVSDENDRLTISFEASPNQRVVDFVNLNSPTGTIDYAGNGTMCDATLMGSFDANVAPCTVVEVKNDNLGAWDYHCIFDGKEENAEIRSDSQLDSSRVQSIIDAFFN